MQRTYFQRVSVLALLLAILLVGCARSAGSALPSAVPPGDLPTPRISTAAAETPTSMPATPTLESTATPSITQTPALHIDALDTAAIRRIETADPVLMETGDLMPFYRAGRELRRYQTAVWTYILDPQTHFIVEILPVNETAELGGSPLTPAELDQAARLWVGKAAPDTKLEGLTANPSSQSGNTLFRWEDHSLPLLEDGHSYPFIQVALSLSGQLLNYFNTLPLRK